MFFVCFPSDRRTLTRVASCLENLLNSENFTADMEIILSEKAVHSNLEHDSSMIIV